MRGKNTGVENDPMLIAWMPQAVPAKSYYPESPGRWVAEAQWPSPRIKPRRWVLNADGKLGERAGKPAGGPSRPGGGGRGAGCRVLGSGFWALRYVLC